MVQTRLRRVNLTAAAGKLISDSRFVLTVINHAKVQDRHDPIYKSSSCKCRLEPGEQSGGILPFQNCPNKHLVRMTFDLLGRGLQLYGGAVTGTIRCRETGYQVALLAEIIEQFLAKLASSDQCQATDSPVIWSPSLRRQTGDRGLAEVSGSRASTTATLRLPRWPAASEFPIRDRKRTTAGQVRAR